MGIPPKPSLVTTTPPMRLGDRIDRAQVDDLLGLASEIGRMDDIVEAHRLWEELLGRAVKVVVARHLAKHPDARIVLEVLRRFDKADKWYSAPRGL